VPIASARDHTRSGFSPCTIRDPCLPRDPVLDRPLQAAITTGWVSLALRPIFSILAHLDLERSKSVYKSDSRRSSALH